MTNQQQIIGALAMDLKRVAVAKNDGSVKVAERFWQEVMNRKKEFVKSKLPNYLNNLYDQIENNKDKDNLLMYSVILQNYARRCNRIKN
ncbi:MAG: hypothetical protein ACD_19C00427G0015 [uncultured bacterium]|nr:MAG: hypothetical protein ACD_19C00427G0015 [uncultured bacterium]